MRGIIADRLLRGRLLLSPTPVTTALPSDVLTHLSEATAKLLRPALSMLLASERAPCRALKCYRHVSHHQQ